MTGLPYNRSEIEPNTRALAEQMNGEFIKIQQAFAEFTARYESILIGQLTPNYTWMAFADSADGTANFTTGNPEGRTYIGIAYNRAVSTESVIPSDYTWSRYRGEDGVNGQDGTDGVDGVDGQDALGVTSAPAAVVVPASAIGVVRSGALPFVVNMQARVAGVDVTPLVVWGNAVASHCQVTNLGSGQYRVDDIAADIGSFEVSATHVGQTVRLVVPVSKVRAGEPAQRSSLSGLGTPTSSWAPATGTIQLNITPDSTVTISMSAGYTANVAGSARIQARLMYRNVTDGGAWTQAGTELIGSYSTYVGTTEPEITPGSIGGEAVALAPASTKVYEFRVDWIKAGSSSITVFDAIMEVKLT